MYSANHWGGSLEITNGGGIRSKEEEESRNISEWDRASVGSHHRDNHRHHELDETQQSWLLGQDQDQEKKNKYVDLGCVVCSRKALRWTVWGVAVVLVVIALPIIITKSLPKHKPRPTPPDNYTLALHKALLFFNAQKCTFSSSSYMYVFMHHYNFFFFFFLPVCGH